MTGSDSDASMLAHVRLPFLTLPTLFAAAVFSLVVAVPFQPPRQGMNTGAYALELSMAPSRDGVVQVFYPGESGALSESTSSRLPLEKGRTPRTYRLPLPAGRYEELRFDPLTWPGAVTIEALRIITRGGRFVRPLPFSALKPRYQIQSMDDRDGRMEITTTPDADDPQLTIAL